MTEPFSGIDAFADPPGTDAPDPSFTNVDAMGKWLYGLFYPEYNDPPWLPILVFDGRWGEIDRRLMDPWPPANLPIASILRDYEWAQFFNRAHVLSGQRIGRDDPIGKQYDALKRSALRNNNYLQQILKGYNDLRVTWEGTAADEADNFIGPMADYLEDFSNYVDKAADLMLAYASIIEAARQNLNLVHGSLVKAFEKKVGIPNDLGEEIPPINIGVILFNTVVAAAIAYATAGTGTAAQATFAAGLSYAVPEVIKDSIEAKNDVKVDPLDLHGRTWGDIVGNFFNAEAKVIEKACEGLHTLEGDLLKLKDSFDLEAKVPPPR